MTKIMDLSSDTFRGVYACIKDLDKRLEKLEKKQVKTQSETTAPTEKQIAFADTIAECLGLNFPIASWQYTKEYYRIFISTYVKEFRSQENDTGMCEDHYDSDRLWEDFH